MEWNSGQSIRLEIGNKIKRVMLFLCMQNLGEEGLGQGTKGNIIKFSTHLLIIDPK